MSWLSKISSRISNALRAFKGISFASIVSGASGWWSRGKVSTRQLMDQYRGWVFKCVRKIAEKIGAIHIRLYRKTGTGDQRDWEEIEEHPLLDLLNAPGKKTTRSELFQMWSMHDDLTGNGYWLLEDVTSEEDIPSGITILNPANMSVKVINGEVAWYEYQTETRIERYQPWQILHFRCPNPNSPFVGMGPTEGAIDSIEALNWANEWNKKFFQNSGRPGIILETDQVDEKMVKLLRETFDDRFAGADKAHRTAVLPKGVKVSSQSGTASQKDMDFSTLLTKMRDDIIAAFGVPAVILGLGLGETMNRASAETLEYVFAVHTIEPKMKRFVEFLNVYLVSRFGDDLILDFDSPVPANVEQQIMADKAALNNAPYKSVNEVRADRGLAPIDGGDAVMGSALAVSIGAPEKKVNPGSVHQTHLRKSMKAVQTVAGRKARPKREMVDNITAGIGKALTKYFKQTAELRIKTAKDLTSGDWEPKWQAMVKRVVPFENELKKAMAKYAVGMTDRAEANVAEATKDVKALDMNELLDDEEEVAAIIKVIGPIFEEILKTEGAAAAEMVGAAFDATDERVQDALAKAMQLMAQNYNAETVALLQAKLQEGIDEGDGIAELKKRVQEVGEFSASTRAETVAKTEAFRTANFATKEAWKQSGVVKELKWYTAKDELVCNECAPMDGEVVGIDENFLDKGDETATGRTITYADVEGGALHPNCRCYIRPETIET